LERVNVVVQSQAELFEVVRALDPARCFACRLYRWQEQGDQNSDNGDYHQKLNQCEKRWNRNMVP